MHHLLKKKIIRALAPLIFASLCTSAQANSADSETDTVPFKSFRKKHTLYHIKPNTPSYAPSGLSPSQVRNAYGFSQLAAEGEGQIIAIIDAYDNPNAESDLNVFSSTFGLPACTTANGCFEKVYASGKKPQASKGWGTEIALDIQWAHAIAPKAKILLVEAADDYNDSLNTAIKVAIEKGASVVSMSFGGGETSGETELDAQYQVPGVEFVASAGDGGDGVICPACSPYVIGVGGTTLKINSSGTYVSEKAWAGTGGGLSVYEAEPSFQSSYPIPNNSKKRRGVPDVAYNSDPNTAGYSVYNTYQNPGWLVIGGTSAAAPQWAGLIAVAKSSTTTKLTGIHAMLYNIAKAQSSTAFHDITTGTNGNCGYMCTAQVGYDYLTGLGTPIANKLIPLIASNKYANPQ